jgi:hypothetical protein
VGVHVPMCACVRKTDVGFLSAVLLWRKRMVHSRPCVNAVVCPMLALLLCVLQLLVCVLLIDMLLLFAYRMLCFFGVGALRPVKVCVVYPLFAIRYGYYALCSTSVNIKA